MCMRSLARCTVSHSWNAASASHKNSSYLTCTEAKVDAHKHKNRNDFAGSRLWRSSMCDNFSTECCHWTSAGLLFNKETTGRVPCRGSGVLNGTRSPDGCLVVFLQIFWWSAAVVSLILHYQPALTHSLGYVAVSRNDPQLSYQKVEYLC